MSRAKSALADPWTHAAKAERSYITPEDITAALAAKGFHGGVMRVVLKAIADGKAEDVKLCAFVASRAGSPSESDSEAQ